VADLSRPVIRRYCGARAKRIIKEVKKKRSRRGEDLKWGDLTHKKKPTERQGSVERDKRCSVVSSFRAKTKGRNIKRRVGNTGVAKTTAVLHALPYTVFLE
jgi:hypothetical protein